MISSDDDQNDMTTSIKPYSFTKKQPATFGNADINEPSTSKSAIQKSLEEAKKLIAKYQSHEKKNHNSQDKEEHDTSDENIPSSQPLRKKSTKKVCYSAIRLTPIRLCFFFSLSSTSSSPDLSKKST